jgi:hypothetical protein
MFKGYQSCSPGVKRLKREADHSPPSRARVKNKWSYTATLICLCGVHVGKPYFYLLQTRVLRSMSGPRREEVRGEWIKLCIGT